MDSENIQEARRKGKNITTNRSQEMTKRTKNRFALTKPAFVPILPSRMDRSKRIYRVLLSLVALWCIAIVAAPLSRAFGFPSAVSASLYSMFSRVCHQFPDRSFVLAGEPFGVCIRCTAIYFGFFAMLAVFPLLGRVNSPAVPHRWILAAALAPMALDVTLNVLGVHASSVFTRLVTGSLAGTVLPLYVVPPLIQAFNKFFSSGESLDAR